MSKTVEVCWYKDHIDVYTDVDRVSHYDDIIVIIFKDFSTISLSLRSILWVREIPRKPE